MQDSSDAALALEGARSRNSGWQLRWLTLKALAVFILIDVGFSLVGFDWVRRRALRGKTRIALLSGAAADSYIANVVAAVQRATRMYYRKRLDCLPKSLTLFVLLKNRLPVDLCVGVKKFPFAAHAWVEYGGRIIADAPARIALYTVLSRD